MGSFLIRLLLSSNLQRQTLLEKYLLWIILEDRLYGGVDPLELTWPLGTRKINISFFFFPIHFIHCHFSVPNLQWPILEFLSHGTQREEMCEHTDTLWNWYSILNMSEQPGLPGMRQSKCVMWRNGTWRSVSEGRLKGSDRGVFSLQVALGNELMPKSSPSCTRILLLSSPSNYLKLRPGGFYIGPTSGFSTDLLFLEESSEFFRSWVENWIKNMLCIGNGNYKSTKSHSLPQV